MAAAATPTTPAEVKGVYDTIVKRSHPSEDFDISRKALGKGSFGTVFQGTDRRSGLKVALKFSHNHLTASAMDGARSEAVLMQSVS